MTVTAPGLVLGVGPAFDSTRRDPGAETSEAGFREWSGSMGFDIFFVPSRLRDEVVEKKNPFTGEVMSVRPPEPLTDLELRAVREVLRGAGATETDEFGS